MQGFVVGGEPTRPQRTRRSPVCDGVDGLADSGETLCAQPERRQFRPGSIAWLNDQLRDANQLKDGFRDEPVFPPEAEPVDCAPGEARRQLF